MRQKILIMNSNSDNPRDTTNIEAPAKVRLAGVSLGTIIGSTFSPVSTFLSAVVGASIVLLVRQFRAKISQKLFTQDAANQNLATNPEDESLKDVIELVESWMADESGYDEETYPQIEAALNQNRV